MDSSKSDKPRPQPNRRRVLQMLAGAATVPLMPSVLVHNAAKTTTGGITDISLNAVTSQWLEPCTRMASAMDITQSIVADLSASGSTVSATLAKRAAQTMLGSTVTITHYRDAMRDACIRLGQRAHDIDFPTIRSQIAHEIEYGSFKLRPWQTVDGLASELYSLSHASAEQMNAALDEIMRPLELNLQKLTEIGSNNPMVRKELHKLKRSGSHDPDDFPAFGTLHNPLRTNAYNQCADFYDKPETQPLKLAADSKPCIITADSEPTPYVTQRPYPLKSPSWGERMIEVPAGIPTLKR